MTTGAYQSITAKAIRVVQVIQEIEGTPGSFPNQVVPCVYKCMPVTISYSDIEGGSVGISVSKDIDRAIYVANFRNNVPLLGGYYVVFRLDNGKYIFDNQMAFEENQ